MSRDNGIIMVIGEPSPLCQRHGRHRAQCPDCQEIIAGITRAEAAERERDALKERVRKLETTLRRVAQFTCSTDLWDPTRCGCVGCLASAVLTKKEQG